MSTAATAQQTTDARRAQGVLVIGSASVDLTAFAEQLPAPGQTVLGESFTLVPGGKGLNQAIAAARAAGAAAQTGDGTHADNAQAGAARVFFAGAIGRDHFGEMIAAALRDAGVNTAHLTVSQEPTGVAHIRVDGRGENNIIVVPHANHTVTAAQAKAAVTASSTDCRVLLLQLEIPLPAVLAAVEAGQRAGMRVILDPAPAAALPEQIWQYLDWVTPNESEATALTGITVTDQRSAARAGAWFIERGVRHALITLADAGSVLVTANGSEYFAPFKVAAVDTTAAGDSFAGYLATQLAQGADPAAAVRGAPAAGALAVTEQGASCSIPTAVEVRDFLALAKPQGVAPRTVSE